MSAINFWRWLNACLAGFSPRRLILTKAGKLWGGKCGAAVDFDGTPRWCKQTALANLGITEKLFALTNGNVQGYAAGKTFAVSPFAFLPAKTTFHELAHIVLGHTSEAAVTDDEQTPQNLQEVEAEAVALILCETLGLAGADYARGYMQIWLGSSGEIPERNAQRIFAAADRILKAGELR